MRIKLCVLALVLTLLFGMGCNAQNAQQTNRGNGIDRPPAVAGQFYPAQKEELKLALQQLFAKAAPPKGLKNVVAIIAPHAGYPYSGEVAASSFNQIDASREYENIFVLGPSHYVGFEGASIYSQGNFVTPLGPVKVNTQLAEELIKKYKFFSNRTDAHQSEHSIEVELPFLQYVMKKEFKIVPIVVGAGSAEMYAHIADALRPYLNPKNLFIISTDFSHYPAYSDAVTVDKATGDAVLSNSPENLIRTVNSTAARKVANLATSMCGLADVLTLLYMTQNDSRMVYTPIEYKNSGDADPSHRQQVVGYYAIAVSIKEDNPSGAFNLTGEDKKKLLDIARSTVEHYVRDHKVVEMDASKFSEILKTKCGAFVTLKENNELRGCIGRFDATEPLFAVVQQMAVASAAEDTRFTPVKPEELGHLEIEISVLTPMRRIRSIDEIQLGRHGVYLRKGMRSGTFLPQVATETGWTKEEFLGHCAQDKAGIGWDGWKDAEIYVYEAIVFSEKEFLK
jgi:AmmeMemoRadiSam system protein B/AmmeMemoRadiSam system protein A